MQKNKMLLIGWDAADWQVIEPMMREGKMPALQQMVNQGVSGNIATLNPVLSPMLWSSIATGKRAYDHGICGFVQHDPLSAEIVPVKSTTRNCKAIWNILNEAGLKTSVVNWWPSHPAEMVNGAYVSNHFHQAAPAFGKDWPLDRASVYPVKWYDRLKELRLHPAELTLSHVLPFIPEAKDLDPEKDEVLKATMRILAHCSSVHNATTLLMEETEWDFMAVYHEAIDHFSHLAMQYHPPKMEGMDEESFRRYHKIIEAAYRFHDMMLERLLELAGPECDVVLLSDHGFQSGNLRVPELPDIPAAPALEHRKYGVFAAMGPSFQAGKKIYGTSLLDVAPTVLHNLGLPVGEDMEGKVLQDAFRVKEPISKIPSWEVTGNNPRFVEEENGHSSEMLDQLQELGYIDLQRDDKSRYVEHELLCNLCTSLLDGRKLEQARAKAKPAWRETKDLRFGLLLSEVYLQLGEQDSLEELLAEMEIEFPGNASLLFISGLNELRKNDQETALEKFYQLEDQGIVSVQLYNEIGRAFLIGGNLKAAISYFDKALSLDQNNAFALTGKAQCLLEKGKHRDALALLDASLQLTFYQPNAHYLMAQAALKLDRTDLAKSALQICLKQAPKHQKAALLLKELSGNEEHENKAVIVVSGFPRSGTSMMMKMLREGGLPIYEDGQRAADEHNPEGYFEHVAVKALGKESDWVSRARGEVLKVVSPLLRYLPATEHYKVVLLKRPLTEVILSQEVMKGKDREEVMRNFPFQMAVDLQNEEQRLLSWLEMQPNINFIEVNYYDCLEKPAEVLEKLSEFLGQSIDSQKAQKAVLPSLHRNKLGKS